MQSLEQTDPFFSYQDIVHDSTDSVASHQVICQAIHAFGKDYRFETALHPVRELQSRTEDNTRIGRDPSIPGYNAPTFPAK